MSDCPDKCLSILLTRYKLPPGGRRAASIFVIGAADVLQSGNEVVQNLSRYHDTVAVGAYLFGDTHHAAAGIALEVNKEGLAVSNDFLCANDIVVHCFLPGVVIVNPYGCRL